MNLDVQSEGSPTAVTEVAGREMICGAGLCSMQGPVHQGGCEGGGHRVLCVHIDTHTHTNLQIYIYIFICVCIFIYIYINNLIIIRPFNVR